MGVPIPDMTENCDWYMLPGEELFQIPDQFADPFSRHHHVVDKVDGLLPGIESIERGIEGLAGLPQLLPLLRIEGDHGIGREAITATDLGHPRGLCTKIGPCAISIQLHQEGGGRVCRDAVLRPSDQIECVGIHHFQRTRTQLQQLRHRIAHIF